MKFGAGFLNGSASVEVVMMMKDNTRHAGLFVAHGGGIHLPESQRPGKGFRKLMQGPFIAGMLARSATAKSYAMEIDGTCDFLGLAEEEEEEASNSECNPEGMLVPTSARVVGKVALIQPRFRKAMLPGLRLISRGSTSSTNTARNKAVLELFTLMHREGDEDYISKGLQSRCFEFYPAVEVRCRPPYCTKMATGCFYTVDAGQSVVRVGRLDAIFKFLDQYYVHLTLMAVVGIDEDSGLKILQEEGSTMCSIHKVLGPRYVIHLCTEDSECTTIGPGFKGVCNTTVSAQYLDIEHIVL